MQEQVVPHGSQHIAGKGMQGVQDASVLRHGENEGCNTVLSFWL